MFKTALPLLAAVALIASCQDSAIEPSQSLVGARQLPSAKALAREKIFIVQDSSQDRLTFELDPDETLLVTHRFFGAEEQPPDGTVRGEESLRMSPEVAARVRHLLWRLRPAELGGFKVEEARPLGCERKGPHDFGEVTVAFSKEGGGAGVEDDQIGIFELPTSESCNTPAAIQAQAVIWRALQLLPKSRVATTFDRLN